MAEFTVHGPFKIPTKKRYGGGRELEVKEFWQQSKLSRLKGQRGVYVFAIKPSKAKTFTPYYVGQTTKTFEREVFTDRNLRKYENALNDFKKGISCTVLA
jgi:hypothetical protein